MKKVLYSLIFSIACLFQIQAQVQNNFNFTLTGGNTTSLEMPTVCQGFPLEICGSYGLDQDNYWTFISLDVPGLSYTLESFDEVEQTYCISLSEDNYANVTCQNIVVTLVFEDPNGNEITVSSSGLEFCLDQIECECLFYEVSNIQCYNNGTADFEDDYWSFDIVVYNNIDSTSSWVGLPIDISGNYGVGQTVIVGDIMEFGELVFNIFDTTAPDDCPEVKVELQAPDYCSDNCEFFLAAEVSECQDGGTPDNLGDDVYDVSIDITSSTLDTWEVYRTYVNDNFSELLATGVGDSKIELIGESIIFGDWVLSGYIENDPSCTAVEFIDAPAFCSGCQEVIVNNIVCDDQGTPFDGDDTWSFDVQVLGGTGSEFRIPEFEIQEPYGSIVSLDIGLIQDCIELLIFDVDNPLECQSTAVICPPETCSEDNTNCGLVLDVLKIECVKIGNDQGYQFIADVDGTLGACWEISRELPNGQMEVLKEGVGDADFKLGPFPDGESFNLTVVLCDDPSCLASFFVEAPDCPTLKPEGFNLRSTTKTSVFPNPVRDNIIQINFAPDVLMYSIFDIQGHQVLGKSLADESVLLPIQLEAGIYIIQTESSSGETEQIKFIRL